MSSLFELGPFTLPSGKTTHFKIECDVLTTDDWAALARLAVELLPPFGSVEGVPRGGVRFATELRKYAYPDSNRLLIADDVWVTGRSMERYLREHTSGRDVLGIVAFTRNISSMPPWVRVLFALNPAAEEATYRLDQQPHIVPG